jgi:microcystin-dependent protein
VDEMLGIVKRFAGTFAPVGFMDCDGTKLPINQNTALFSILGTTYGGNGTTDFALPDLRPKDKNGNREPWGPDHPRFLICVRGIFPSRS